MILRDYQEEIKERVYAAWNAGCRGVMCQMPTGTGKTVVTAQIVFDSLACPMEKHWERGQKTTKVLVVAHRKEILEQTKETLEKYGLGDRVVDGSIIVDSIQKLTSKKSISFLSLLTGEDAQRAGEGLLVVIDEAHHCTAKTYRKLWTLFPEAKFLGMTATPCRMKEEGFDELFDKLICADDVSVFIKNGWLSMYEYYAAKPNSDMIYNVRALRDRGIDGDYKVGEMGSLMDNRASIEQLYKAYKDYAEGKQGIIYAINKEHAAHIASFYAERIEADGKTSETQTDHHPASPLKGEKGLVAVVDSDTPKEERERINREYREGKIRILVNCEIYGEGYDVPFVQFIQLARPTLSLSKYLQQVGRGLRPHKDKKATVILDCVGNCYRFGMPNDVRDWQKMFRGGQIEGTHGSCVYIDSRDFQYMAMQARNILDVDDGHDHEMEQIVSFRDLEREIDRTCNVRQTGISPLDGRFVLNDFTNDVDSVYLPKGISDDYYNIEKKLAEEPAPHTSRKFMQNGLMGLKVREEVVLPAIYWEIIRWSDDYAYVNDRKNMSYLVNMKNEVVYKEYRVVEIYRDDIIKVDKDTGRSSNYHEYRYVDLRDGNHLLHISMPVRHKIGNLNFIETEEGIYRYSENTKLQFLKSDLCFDDNGVMKVDAIVKSAMGKTITIVAFHDDDYAYTIQGEHRSGDLILKRFGDKRLYRSNGKDRPTEWKASQRDLMLQMKR